jgi:hypothetical protein
MYNTASNNSIPPQTHGAAHIQHCPWRFVPEPRTILRARKNLTYPGRGRDDVFELILACHCSTSQTSSLMKRERERGREQWRRAKANHTRLLFRFVLLCSSAPLLLAAHKIVESIESIHVYKKRNDAGLSSVCPSNIHDCRSLAATK